MDTISDHVSFDEATYSRDYPELVAENRRYARSHPDVLRNAKFLALMILEEVLRGVLALTHRPLGIRVNSFIRCPTLNAEVGSRSTSQHIQGQACDFVLVDKGAPGHPVINTVAVFRWIIEESLISYHQCYYDDRGGFIHISLPTGINDGQWWIIDHDGRRVEEFPV